MKFSKPLSIKFILCIVLLISILPMNLLYISSARQSIRALTSQANSTTQSLLSLACSDVDKRISQTQAYMDEIINTNVFYSSISRAENYDSYKTNKFFLVQDLLSSSNLGTQGDVYYIYSPKWDDTLIARPSRMMYGTPYDILYSYTADEIEGLKSHGTPWRMIMIGGKPYLTSCKYVNQIYFGTLISLSFVDNYLLSSIVYDSVNLSYHSEEPDMDKINTKETLACCSHPLRSCPDFFLLCSIQVQDILKDLSFFQRNSYTLAIGYLILIPVLLALLFLFLIMPLDTLLHVIQEIGKGNTEQRVGKRRYANEYQTINQTFDTTLDTLNQLKIEKYEIELTKQQTEMEKQQIELQNLQLMIRPHFLQNTLGLLYSLSQMEQTEELGEAILYLSDYFRYVYRANNVIPFSIELKLIEEYLDMAALQYPETFQINYDIPEDISQISVPPMLIHNFIENIISHASRKGDYLTIQLILVIEDNTAIFTIIDDGIGIPEGYVNEINQGHPIRDKERTHVGVYNSFKRLEKIYNGKASLHFDSELFEGTTVTVKIPLSEKAEE